PGRGVVTAADSRRIARPHISLACGRRTRGSRWVCGLCTDAIDDELGCTSSPISPAEALDRAPRLHLRRRMSLHRATVGGQERGRD
ncbi:Os09g0566700, partial [Oryza sativa Japonica Group]